MRPRPSIAASLVLLVAAMLGLGCSTGALPVETEAPDDTCSPDLASIQETIFTKSCATSSCHAGPTPAAKLDLGAVAESALLGVAATSCPDAVLVVGGSAADSFLFQKLSAQPPCGESMPVGHPLTAEEQSCIERWIDGLPEAHDPPCERCGGDQCLELDTDPAHCGACEVACAAGELCAEGECVCPEGLTACSGQCVDTLSDPNHCNGCGEACPAGASCTEGACACAGGLALCDGACVDTQLDPGHCGSCDEACAIGASCGGGACQCPDGQDPCNGVCVALGSDLANCGSCGAVCDEGKVCANGDCATECGALVNCSNACVDLDTSAANCGGCGSACPLGASCADAQCACPAGSSVCDGACLNTTTDPSHCGGCDTVCPLGQVCAAGLCECPAGAELCSGACVDTSTDAGNCGACGNACGGGQTCQDGACACPNGGTTCNGICLDLQTDAASCGACGNVCAVGQTCVAGACTCGQASVSFAAAVQPILTANCTAGCHSPGGTAFWLNLTPGISYSKLVNVNAGQCAPSGRKRVLPGEPSQSYVIDKLMNVDLCGMGAMMPPGSPLPAADIQTMADWICSGAPNN